MSAKKKLGFEEYYSGIYDKRWPELKLALLGGHEDFSISEGLLQPYYLDRASAAAAESLGVQPGDRVLDMCAAPGGKSLILAVALHGSGRLVSNDRSSERRRRLRDVLDSHLPQEYRMIVEVSGHDASRWSLYEQNAYDRILLDAPCSSERHVLNSPSHLRQWAPSRTRQLSIQAHAMLAAAVEAVRPGGVIIYSTCALSPLENDGVISKLLKKRSGLVDIDPVNPRSGIISSLKAEPTEYGLHILPDQNSGWGPIYLARLIKKTNL